jgi:hypothetical protein
MTFRVAVFAVVLVAGLLSSAAAESSSQMSSPNGDYTVRILDKKLPGADFYFGDQTIALYHGRKLLSQFPTTGFLLHAYWSPECEFRCSKQSARTRGRLPLGVFPARRKGDSAA